MSDFRVHTDCPSLAELAAFVAGDDDTLRQHMESCRRCAALVRGIRHGDAETVARTEPLAEFTADLPARPGGAVTEPGDVVLASSPDAPGTLLVSVVLDVRPDSDPPTLEVAPLSTELSMAADFDVVLGAEEPLGYSALVEVWNHGTLAAPQVDERLGRLSDTTWAAIDRLYRALLADTPVAEVDIPRGVPIVAGRDPRAEFQEIEADRARDFWKPAARLYSEAVETETASTVTVGRLLSSYLRRTGWDIPSYAAHIGWSVDELAALSDDSFDPRALQPERIGTIASAATADVEEFEAALRRSITADQFSGLGSEAARSPGMAFPRRAWRLERRSGRPSAKVPRDPAADLERYVRRAMRAFRRALDR